MTRDVRDWADEIAVVTGAGGSMGSHVVAALLDRGAQVVGIDAAAALVTLREGLGANADRFTAIELDITDVTEVERAFAEIDSRVGPVSMLVNFAGIVGPPGSVFGTPANGVHRVLEVNVMGTYWMCQQAMLRMRDQGRGSIVNISSTNALMARRADFTHPYAASKAAVIGLTTSLASEAAAWGVRVNCVAPGMHLSQMQKAMYTDDAKANASSFVERAIAFTPLGRAGTGNDMVGPVLFLLGDESAFMTGQTITSDGGRSMWYD